MNVDEHHLEVAKETLKQNDSIAGAAGAVANVTPPSTELQYLIAVANQAKNELDKQNDN